VVPSSGMTADMVDVQPNDVGGPILSTKKLTGVGVDVEISNHVLSWTLLLPQQWQYQDICEVGGGGLTMTKM